MGLFDKLKGMVKGAQEAVQPSQPPAEPPPQEAHAHEDHEHEDHDHGSDDHDDSEVDDWGGWDPNNHEEFWYRLKAIEQAGNDNGDDACDAKCREFGLRDWSHMQRVRDTFNRHFGHTHEFMQAAMNANSRSAREQFGAAAAANSHLLEPVEGIDMQTYAFTQAKAAQGGDFQKVLADAGMDQAKWDRVSAEWNRRMSGQAGDQNATMAVIMEYGKYFGMAGQGQFGAAAAANAGQAGIQNYGQGATGPEPCTMERYAEIGGAQAVWAEQGRDVNAMLRQQFNMNALDWSNLSQYWSAKIAGDYRVALQINEIQQKYEAQYRAAGGGGADDDLNA